MRLREKALSYPGLKELLSVELMCTKLLYHRLYLLQNRKSSGNHHDTGRVKDYIESMGLSMAEHHFTGKRPMRILNFLVRFVREPKSQGMRKAQEFIKLPASLTDMVRSEYKIGVAVTANTIWRNSLIA